MNKNTIKILLLSLALALPLTGFAHPSPGKTSSGSEQCAGQKIFAGPCVHLHSLEDCVGYPTGECFWDAADQRCESYNNSEDRCSRIDDKSECIRSQYNCFWDNDDQRCESR